MTALPTWALNLGYNPQWSPLSILAPRSTQPAAQNQNLRRRLSLTKTCFNQLNRGIWCSSISITTLPYLIIYIQPILLYDSKTRALSKALEDKIIAFDNICLRRILWISYPDQVNNIAVQLHAGSPTQLLPQIQARWLNSLKMWQG